MLTLLSSCSKEGDIRFRAQRLVDRHAAAWEAETEFGAVSHTYTREEVLGYLEKTPGEDKAIREDWQRLAQHPRTLYFSPGELRQLFLFLDDQNRVTGYYLTSQ